MAANSTMTNGFCNEHVSRWARWPKDAGAPIRSKMAAMSRGTSQLCCRRKQGGPYFHPHWPLSLRVSPILCLLYRLSTPLTFHSASTIIGGVTLLLLGILFMDRKLVIRTNSVTMTKVLKTWLCSWSKHFENPKFLLMWAKITHLSSQVLAMGKGELDRVRGGEGGGGEPCDELASHPMGVTIFLFASSYRTEKASFYFLYRWEMLTVLLLRLDSILLIDYKHLKCLWGNWWNVWLFWCDWFSRIAKFLSGKSAKLSTQIFFVKF